MIPTIIYVLLLTISLGGIGTLSFFAFRNSSKADSYFKEILTKLDTQTVQEINQHVPVPIPIPIPTQTPTVIEPKIEKALPPKVITIRQTTPTSNNSTSHPSMNVRNTPIQEPQIQPELLTITAPKSELKAEVPEKVEPVQPKSTNTCKHGWDFDTQGQCGDCLMEYSGPQVPVGDWIIIR